MSVRTVMEITHNGVCARRSWICYSVVAAVVTFYAGHTSVVFQAVVQIDHVPWCRHLSTVKPSVETYSRFVRQSQKVQNFALKLRWGGSVLEDGWGLAVGIPFLLRGLMLSRVSSSRAERKAIHNVTVKLLLSSSTFDNFRRLCYFAVPRQRTERKAYY